MGAEDYAAYTKALDESEFEILRTTPRVERLVADAHNCALDTRDFPFVDPGDLPEGYQRGGGKKKNAGVSRRKNYGKRWYEDDLTEQLTNPRIIVFVVGGMGNHEIVALNNLQRKRIVNC